MHYLIVFLSLYYIHWVDIKRKWGGLFSCHCADFCQSGKHSQAESGNQVLFHFICARVDGLTRPRRQTCCAALANALNIIFPFLLYPCVFPPCFDAASKVRVSPGVSSISVLLLLLCCCDAPGQMLTSVFEVSQLGVECSLPCLALVAIFNELRAWVWQSPVTAAAEAEESLGSPAPPTVRHGDC